MDISVELFTFQILEKYEIFQKMIKVLNMEYGIFLSVQC